MGNKIISSLVVVAAAVVAGGGMARVFAAVPLPEPTLVSIVVLDVSGSMDDGKLELAKKEIAEKARQLSPSPLTPWIIVPFNERPQDVRKFDNGFDKLAAYLKGISAGGGTNIASGLERAIAEAAPFARARHVFLSLYTDGEDANLRAVDAQQVRLDGLFAQRTEQGLGQTVICRRWGTSNADLIARLKKSGKARVIDAGEGHLLHSTFDPKVAVESSQWLAGAVLEINLTAEIRLQGQKLPGQLPPLPITCTTAGVEGDKSLTVVPGAAAPIKFKVRLSLDPSQIPAMVRLDFSVGAAPPAISVAQGVMVATLVQDRLSVTVRPPALIRQVKLSASGVQSTTSWSDPLRWQASANLSLALSVESELAAPFQEAVEFVIKPDKGVVIKPGTDRFTVKGPGKVAHNFSVEFDAKRAVRVGFTIEPTAAPSDLIVTPVPLVVTVEIAPPTPATTRIDAEEKSVGEPRWVNLREGTGRVEALLSVRVEGPLMDKTPLVLKASSAVQDVQLSPTVLRSGEQTIRLIVQLPLREAPNSTQVELMIEPPASQGAVTFTGGKPVTLAVAGPPPARLYLAMQNGVLHKQELPLPENGRPAKLIVTPLLTGIANDQTATGVNIGMRLVGPVKQLSGADAYLGRPMTVELIPRDTGPPSSIFKDSLFQASLEVNAAPETPRVIGSSYAITLRRDAAFKRWLFWTTGTLFVLLLAWFPWRLMRRLQAAVRAEDDGQLSINPNAPNLGT